MCDTVVARSISTADGATLFGKNSDRERNEAQVLEYHPSSKASPDTVLNCTYISLPQVRRTHAVLLSRPFWTWGAEMGANEHGLVIGNEGLHARTATPLEKALIGMDLVRLGLERARRASEAVEVITGLLAKYGQGGNCGHLAPAHYHNGFLIADAEEAFVLETVGREWMLERVRTVRAISNRYSIGRDCERVSSGMRALVRDDRMPHEPQPNYAELLADPNREHIGNAGARQACSTALLRAREGHLTVADIMRTLRDHGDGHAPWRLQCLTQRTVCMHAGDDERGGQTVGSMVSELSVSRAVHWVTGTAAPCISIFKPLLMDVPIPFGRHILTDRFDGSTLWWQHERLHRAAVLGDFGEFLERVRAERDALEEQFRLRIASVSAGASAIERAAAVRACWTEAAEIEHRWHERGLTGMATQGGAHTRAWTKFNQLAGIELAGDR